MIGENYLCWILERADGSNDFCGRREALKSLRNCQQKYRVRVRLSRFPPNGEDWRDVTGGFLNAFNTNHILGIGRIESGNSDFRTGQTIGDVVSTIQGAVEILIGGGGEAGGVALDATGVGIVPGVALNGASLGLITHGVAVAGSGLKNLTGEVLERNWGIELGDSLTRPKRKNEKFGLSAQL